MIFLSSLWPGLAKTFPYKSKVEEQPRGKKESSSGSFQQHCAQSGGGPAGPTGRWLPKDNDQVTSAEWTNHQANRLTLTTSEAMLLRLLIMRFPPVIPASKKWEKFLNPQEILIFKCIFLFSLYVSCSFFFLSSFIPKPQLPLRAVSGRKIKTLRKEKISYIISY